MKKVAVLCALAFVTAMVVSASREAEARPQYLKGFATEYEGLKDKVEEKKCGVCHPAKSKKVKNDYGVALGKAIGAKNEKDAEKIKAALGKAGEEKNADGKTFKSIIEGGDLPGGDEAADE